MVDVNVRTWLSDTWSSTFLCSRYCSIHSQKTLRGNSGSSSSSTGRSFSLYLLSQCQRCLIDTSVFLSPFGNEKEIKAFVMPLVATFVKLQVKCLITTGVISMSQFYLHESCSEFWLAVSSTLSTVVKRLSTRLTASTFFLSMILLYI